MDHHIDCHDSQERGYVPLKAVAGQALDHPLGGPGSQDHRHAQAPGEPPQFPLQGDKALIDHGFEAMHARAVVASVAM
jgi:hypothetical protein